MKTLKLTIPATIANLGPGFDVLGASVSLYNEFVFIPDKKFLIQVKNSPEIPGDKTNLVWKSFVFAWKKFSSKPLKNNWQIVINDKIPPGSGLGSSATANLAGVIAAASFLGIKDEKKILTVAVEIEGHPDNIVPAYFGGLWAASWDGKNLHYAKVDNLSDWWVLLWFPERKLLTEKVRKILPHKISRTAAVYNLSRIAFFLIAVKNKDWNVLKISLDDRIHQPYRQKFIPEFGIIKEVSEGSGAYGVVISGSGPSLAIIVPRTKLDRIEKSIREKINYGRFYRLKFTSKGVRTKWV